MFKHGKREEHLDDFIQWCYDGGLNCDYLEIKKLVSNESPKKSEQNAYGLFAKKDIDENELVMSVPDDLMLTTDSIDDPVLLELAKTDPLLRDMPNILLAFQLMHEYYKRSQSKWSPYINIFPSEYTTPLYYTDKDMSFLEGSSSSAIDAIKLCRNIYRQYAYFRKQMDNQNSLFHKLSFRTRFCYDFFRWAVSSVMTRQNVLPSRKGGGQRTALIPFWDMSNHEEGKPSTDYDSDNHKVLCYAMKEFQKGDEFTIYYGKRANADFLLNNGFVDPNNKYNVCYIYLKDGSVSQEVRQVFNISLSNKFILQPKGNELEPNLLKIYVLVQFDSKKLNQATDEIRSGAITAEDWITRERNQNKEIDERVERGIARRCEFLLEKYPKKPKQPETLIQRRISSLIELEKKILQSHLPKNVERHK